MFTDRQKLVIALAGVTALGVVGTWTGVNYYVDRADCGNEVKKANAAATVIRSRIATELTENTKAQNDSDHRLLNAITDVVIDYPNGGVGPGFRKKVREHKAEIAGLDAQAARLTAERAAHPILELPDCDGN